MKLLIILFLKELTEKKRMYNELERALKSNDMTYLIWIL